MSTNEPPARESVDVERLARELASTYFSTLRGPIHLEPFDWSKLREELQATYLKMARRVLELLAPPRESSPAASGEVPPAPEDVLGMNLAPAERPRLTSAQWHQVRKMIDGEIKGRVADRFQKIERKLSKTNKLLDWRVCQLFRAVKNVAGLKPTDKLPDARDSSAAESGRAIKPIPPEPGFSECLDAFKKAEAAAYADNAGAADRHEIADRYGVRAVYELMRRYYIHAEPMTSEDHEPRCAACSHYGSEHTHVGCSFNYCPCYRTAEMILRGVPAPPTPAAPEAHKPETWTDERLGLTLRIVDSDVFWRVGDGTWHLRKDTGTLDDAILRRLLAVRVASQPRAPISTDEGEMKE